MNPHPPEITVFGAQILLGIGILLILALLIFLFVRNRGRRFSFSLRWFMAFCMACSLVVGGGARFHLAREQAREYREAMEAKKRLSEKMTVRFHYPLTYALSFIDAHYETNAVLDPAFLAAHTVNTSNDSLTFHNLTGEQIYRAIAKKNGLQCELKGSRILLIARSPETLAKDAKLEKKLATIVSFNFSNTPPGEALKALGEMAKMEFELNDNVMVFRPGSKITLQLRDIETRSGLEWIIHHAGWNLDGLDHGWSLDILNDGEFCVSPNEEKMRESRLRTEIEKKLNDCKITFEFVGKPLDEALEFIAKSAKVNILLDPRCIASGTSKTPINLHVNSMSADLALKWILKLAKLDYDIRNEAVFCSVKQDI